MPLADGAKSLTMCTHFDTVPECDRQFAITISRSACIDIMSGLSLHSLLIIIGLLGLAARSWINTMCSNKTTLGLMSNVSNSVRLHIVHNPDLGYYTEKNVLIIFRQYGINDL